MKKIEAAGGAVQLRKNHKLLLIFRNGKWDLPKGKLERGESPEEAAIREVKEECGIRSLIITRPLCETYHSYELKGKPVLKKTYWFEMTCQEDEVPVPQTMEGITEARWMDEKEVKKAMENTYPNILEVLKALSVKSG